MLSARNLSLSYSSKTLLECESFSLLKGEKVALVGYNGEGKSSIFRLIAGELVPDAGSVELPASVRLGYLAQEPYFDPKLSVVDSVKINLRTLLEAISDYEAAALREDNHALATLSSKIELLGGFDVDYRIDKALSKLGIKAREQEIGTLSGGEQRRVDLARVLLSAPDLFLLDEPTNHLDIESIAYLAATLKRQQTPVLFISHDRFFIDEIATRILELDKGHLYSHLPPFSVYIANRLNREQTDERTHHRKEQLLKNELEWLKAGVKARTTKQQARIERTLDLKDEVATRKNLLKNKIMSIESAPDKRLAKSILECVDVGFAYGENILFKDVNLTLSAGFRIGIIGPNGCGKTTLLSLITKQQEPTSGHVKIGPHTHYAVFEQKRKSLNADATLKQVVAPDGDFVFIGERRTHVVSYLEKFLFNASELNRRVSTLSGGEQNRLLLAKLFAISANCLIFDEPTNDLDLTSLAVLEEAILAHQGVALIVSHDRAFLDRVCTHILSFEKENTQSTVQLYEGNYSFYEEHYKIKAAPLPQKIVPVVAAKVAKKKRSYKEEQEYLSLGAKIESAEDELSKLQEILNEGNIFKDDPLAAIELSKQISDLEAKINALYERWQELESINQA